MRFERYLTCWHFIDVRVEEHAALFRRDVAALECWRRVDERALCRIAQEGLRNLRSPLLVGFAPFDLGGVAFRLICAFQLMIPRGFAEQVFDLRWYIVRRCRVA